MSEALKSKITVPVMSELFSQGRRPEYLFWVGCAGAFDNRYMKVAKSFAFILNHIKADYAVLGTEEACTGDPARRAGNEMLFQMQALSNIELFKMYEIKKVITICPHCYNTFKNEYPDLGADFKVINYLEFLYDSIVSGKLRVNKEILRNKNVTYHDPCYLGRANEIYDAPRKLIRELGLNLVEMPRNKSFALCCGAGGAQMFKDAEKGNKEIFIERTEEALTLNPDIIATACPFCMTMITDGLKYKDKIEEVQNLDIAEMIALALL